MGPLGRADAVAAGLEAALIAATELAALPAKFGFAVDGGGPFDLDGVRADIRLRWDEGGWRVRLDGGPATPTENPVADAIGLAEAVLAGTAVPRPTASAPTAVPIGLLPGACGLGLPFGGLGAAGLAALAALAERHGDGTLRLTPWRAVLLPGAGPGVLPDAARIGLITDPADPLLHVAACAGRTGCASGSVDARADAAILAQAGLAGQLHVSGCAKGCAHPGRADVTLVGEAGRYGLVLGGTAADPPPWRGLDLDGAIALLRRLRQDAAA